MRPWKDLAFDYIGEGERETERKRNKQEGKQQVRHASSELSIVFLCKGIFHH